MTQVGTVLSLFPLPVKSMLGESPDAIHVSESGFSGDRGWAVRDERRGDFATSVFLLLLQQFHLPCLLLRPEISIGQMSVNE